MCLSLFKRAFIHGFLLCAVVGVQARDCAPPAGAQRAQVVKVLDGDTIMLHNGRSVRLIGLDTPEVARASRVNQPLASAAKQHLQKLLPRGAEVLLVEDTRTHDHYGRQLAYVFSAYGVNLTHELLLEGLGTLLIIPPNVAYAECFAAAEAAARAQLRGVWQLPQYAPLAAAQLPKKPQGYAQVRGTVSKVYRRKGDTYLRLAENFTVRIARADKKYFRKLDFERLNRRQITVRGQLSKHGKGSKITIAHPAAWDIH